MIEVKIDSVEKNMSVKLDGRCIDLVAELGAIVKVVLNELLPDVNADAHDVLRDVVDRAIRLAADMAFREANGEKGETPAEKRAMIADLLDDFVDAPPEAIEEMASEIMMRLMAGELKK